ncbi:hypothetical protein NQ318_020119 [Aromia moschata]|uniref:Uncharacterized protein n=1 Tax=Aromia moschata TaxID=1265417 RepID=A0AAV8ZA54_9CUCU|nr:hypothetical protein NQ318_020119 [Aromia moschata]
MEIPYVYGATVAEWVKAPSFQSRYLCARYPNIPESGEQRLRSSRGDEDCCYTHCGAPGRGERPGAGGGGGGGGSRWSPETFGVCEHCPGRPPAEALPMAPTYRAGARPRTINRVFLLWTAWMTLLLQTDRQIYLSTIQCLLVMCALCVRTPMCWLKTKWRHSCS